MGAVGCPGYRAKALHPHKYLSGQCDPMPGRPGGLRPSKAQKGLTATVGAQRRSRHLAGAAATETWSSSANGSPWLGRERREGLASYFPSALETVVGKAGSTSEAGMTAVGVSEGRRGNTQWWWVPELQACSYLILSPPWPGRVEYLREEASVVSRSWHTFLCSSSLEVFGKREANLSFSWACRDGASHRSLVSCV